MKKETEQKVATTASDPSEKGEAKGNSLIAKLLFVLISLVLLGRSILVILNEHSETSGRYGYVVLTGQKAVDSGYTTLFLALMPLAVLARKKSHAIAWICACMGGFFYLLIKTVMA